MGTRMAAHIEKEDHQVPDQSKGASEHHSRLHPARAQDHRPGADRHSLRRLQSPSLKGLVLSAVTPSALTSVIKKRESDEILMEQTEGSSPVLIRMEGSHRHKGGCT